MKKQYKKSVIISINYEENTPTKDNSIHYKTLKKNGTTYY